MNAKQPRFIGSANPFTGWAQKYLSLGFAPIPLPPRRKNPPPTGWTGHNRPIVNEQQLSKWLNGKDLKFKPDKANIALRLNTIEDETGELWDIIGIDVDHHPEDKDDPKNGGPQLEYLESIYGILPETWISSARTNGVAGIRFYLAPTGLMWRGDCGKGGDDIDIISKNYRFAVCFPSTNPDANDRQYWWYPPGFAPDGDIESIDRNVYGMIPNPKDLPKLPDLWIEFLTNNRIKDVGVPMDMDTKADRLVEWARRNFAPNDTMCEYISVTLDQWKAKLDESNKSHNVLTDAVYHMLLCGATEGHTGWGKACREFEKTYFTTVLDRNKRSPEAAKAEIKRSREGALRRIKGQADEKLSKGEGFFDLTDACDLVDKMVGEIPKAAKDIGDGWPKTKAEDPNKYELNDDGNAKQWLDLHQEIVLYVSNVIGKWILWDGSRWHVDSTDSIAKHLFRRVKQRQYKYAQYLRGEAVKVAGTPRFKEAMVLVKRWDQHALNSGNIANIGRALDAAKSVRQGVSIKAEQLDADRRALGVSNGVIHFDRNGGVALTGHDKKLLITKNTGVPYIPLAEQKNHKDAQVRQGYALFKDFLERFIRPSISDFDYFQKMCGSTLLGEGSNKFAIFFWGPTNTGKSTMLRLMLNSVGEYGDMRNPDIFKSAKLNPALASALPMRLIGVSELGDNEINSDLFKEITGGDKITCELKNKNDLVSDYAQFTIFVTTNGVPRVPKEDTAFRSRLRVIEFKHQADESERTKGKERQQLLYKKGQMACLAWLVEGCARSVSEGLEPIPEEIALATEEFGARLSDVGVFAREWLTYESEGFVSNEDLLFHFETWAQINNFDIRGWSQTKLTQRLKDLGFKSGARKIKDDNGFARTHRGMVNVKMVRGKEDLK